MSHVPWHHQIISISPFSRILSQDETNVSTNVLLKNIPKVRKKGKAKNSWAGQVRQQQQRFGLSQKKRKEIANARSITRIHNAKLKLGIFLHTSVVGKN